MFGGQHRVTPDRELQPEYTGKTIFTSKARVPFIHRVTAVLFCLGFIALCYVFLDRVIRYGDSLPDVILGAFLCISIALFLIIAVLALAGIRPFQSKRRS